MKRKQKHAAVRGSVMLISGMLIASACIRILMGAEAAFAKNSGTGSLVLPEIPTTSQPIMPNQDRVKIGSLLAALHNRETIAESREADLDVRTKALNVAQFEIERRLVALEANEQRLEATLSVAQSASEDDLARLTSVYENMKPKDAAALFEEMEPEFSAGFIARMRPDSAAKIMSGLNPQAAYSISVMLAGRNANAPKS